MSSRNDRQRLDAMVAGKTVAGRRAVSGKRRRPAESLIAEFEHPSRLCDFRFILRSLTVRLQHATNPRSGLIDLLACQQIVSQLGQVVTALETLDAREALTASGKLGQLDAVAGSLTRDPTGETEGLFDDVAERIRTALQLQHAGAARLLAWLSSLSESVVTYESLEARLGYGYRSVVVMISTIRRALRRERLPITITNIRGEGYCVSRADAERLWLHLGLQAGRKPENSG